MNGICMCNTAKEIWKTLLITHQSNIQVKDNKIDLLVQQYEQFVISEDKSIDNAFARLNSTITIQPDFDPFLLSSDKEGNPNLDNLEELLDFDIDEVPQTETDLPPLVCKMGKGSRNKKKILENIMYFNGAGPSSSIGTPLTQEEAERRALAHSIRMGYRQYANVAWVIAKCMKRKGAGSQKDSQICCCQFISKIARKSRVLTEEIIRSLSTLVYCRDLDRTTLRELIDSEDRLIPDIPVDDCRATPQQKGYKEKAVIDSGCSRNMTGNKCYLDEYEDYEGGFASFGDGKGRISGKDNIKTMDHWTFDDKLLDESQILLRVPRKDNIYSVDLKSVVPTGVLSYLIAKAIIDDPIHGTEGLVHRDPVRNYT
ncbi:hypothetical protein Tco_1136678 [Tanacetum coccineum]